MPSWRPWLFDLSGSSAASSARVDSNRLGSEGQREWSSRFGRVLVGLSSRSAVAWVATPPLRLLAQCAAQAGARPAIAASPCRRRRLSVARRVTHAGEQSDIGTDTRSRHEQQVQVFSAPSITFSCTSDTHYSRTYTNTNFKPKYSAQAPCFARLSATLPLPPPGWSPHRLSRPLLGQPLPRHRGQPLSSRRAGCITRRLSTTWVSQEAISSPGDSVGRCRPTPSTMTDKFASFPLLHHFTVREPAQRWLLPQDGEERRHWPRWRTGMR